MIYHTCPHCGANLDPSERCDCRQKAEVPPWVRPIPSAADGKTFGDVILPRSIASESEGETK